MKTVLDPIATELVENPLLARLGLEPSDLYGPMMQARNELLAGNAEGAFQKFARLVLVDPMNVEFQLGMGEAALALELPEIAMQSAALIITEAPDRPEGFLLSGRACLAMGEPALALEDLADAESRAQTAGNEAMARAVSQLAAAARALS